MYKSLYDIRIEHAVLVDELIDSEGELSPELEMALSINEDELTEKAESYALRILEFNGQVDAVDAEIKRLQKRKQSFDKTAERLKETIKAAMIQFNKDKIKTDKITLSFRKSEVVDVPETWADDILRFVSIQAQIDAKKYEDFVTALQNSNAKKEDIPALPSDEVLNYFKLSAVVDKMKMKCDLKEGKTIGEIMLIENKNLQIK